MLLRPRVPENLGAVARALKNFGLADCVLVAPETSIDDPAAVRLAVQSEDVLAGFRSVATLDEAVADCAWVVGTSSRRLRGVRRVDVRAFASEAVRREPVALVFGDERSGLTNDEIERCHDLSAIDTDDAQPSINLAQAVLLYSYEWSKARRGAPAAPVLPVAATDGEVRLVEGALADLLRSASFLHDEGRHAMTELVRPLVRSRLTRDEARLWNAALRAARKRTGP